MIGSAFLTGSQKSPAQLTVHAWSLRLGQIPNMHLRNHCLIWIVQTPDGFFALSNLKTNYFCLIRSKNRWALAICTGRNGIAISSINITVFKANMIVISFAGQVFCYFNWPDTDGVFLMVVRISVTFLHWEDSINRSLIVSRFIDYQLYLPSCRCPNFESMFAVRLTVSQPALIAPAFIEIVCSQSHVKVMRPTAWILVTCRCSLQGIIHLSISLNQPNFRYQMRRQQINMIVTWLARPVWTFDNHMSMI